MIPHLTGWTRGYSGQGVLLVPDDARGAGWIRYTEGSAPLRRLRAIVEAALAEEPRLRQPVVSRPKPIVTKEGEFGALVTVAGSVDGAPARRHLGVVFCDSFFDVVASLVVREDAFARFEAAVALLAEEDSLGLGVRRRRFWYDAPPGWEAFRRGLATEWTPPGFPREKALILVFPASPAESDDVDVVTELVAGAQASGYTADDAREPAETASDHGLSGSWWTLSGVSAGAGRTIREVVLLRDARYVYLAQLEATESAHARHLPAFQKLARSIRPLPAAERRAPGPGEMMRGMD